MDASQYVREVELFFLGERHFQPLHVFLNLRRLVLRFVYLSFYNHPVGVVPRRVVDLRGKVSYVGQHPAVDESEEAQVVGEVAGSTSFFLSRLRICVSMTVSCSPPASSVSS